MVPLSELARYCDRILEVEAFDDYCPNGLQVAGRNEVHRLVTGVTASGAFLRQARDAGADALLVHHGYFWKGEDPRVVGMKADRLGLLLRADIGLLAYHLPLDVHPVYGNNEQLGRRLGLSMQRRVDAGGVPGLLAFGTLEAPLAAAAFAERLEQRLARQPVHIAAGPTSIRSVAWCTGAGQGFLTQAVALGADAYVSGEISERTTHEAREHGLHYFAAGHHASERYGVQALAAHLAARFELEHRFIDVDNPA